MAFMQRVKLPERDNSALSAASPRYQALQWRTPVVQGALLHRLLACTCQVTPCVARAHASIVLCTASILERQLALYVC